MTTVYCTIKNCLNNNDGITCKLNSVHIIREKWDEIPVETCIDAVYTLTGQKTKDKKSYFHRLHINFMP